MCRALAACSLSREPILPGFPPYPLAGVHRPIFKERSHAGGEVFSPVARRHPPAPRCIVYPPYPSTGSADRQGSAAPRGSANALLFNHIANTAAVTRGTRTDRAGSLPTYLLTE